MKYSQFDVDTAAGYLKARLKPGDTVNCILRHVSRSGMSRSISLLVGDQPIDMEAARVLGESLDRKHGGIRITGCGMDMGFSLVYNLSRRLFADGFGCIGSNDAEGPRFRCPSSDHSNGDRDYTPHGAPTYQGVSVPAFKHWHTDGSYALRHRWL